MKLSIYKKSDTEEIKQLFLKVFTDSEGQEEGLLIADLVLDVMTSTDAQDIYGFIATENDQILGSIFFTRLVFENSENAFILSPVAIHTKHQGKCIGQRLINYGIKHLKENGIRLAFTYGDPSFYSKAPFELSQPEGWLCQSLVGDKIEPIAGNSCCVEALNKSEYW